ncbi:MAG TPA: glucose-6-phosphate isomerase, partial [Gammaproteobacteria bacterium]|nr:glucose-6-phosphate isomerase [Gammaproteobacteria bacterium]
AALKSYADPRFHCYFISNVDGSEIQDVLKKIDPEKTLFIISSKSFTTLETLSNANAVRQWLQEKLGQKDISSHFIAVTAAREKAIQWGIPDAQIFSIWDFVGGRYSVWSAIGLPVALMIGMNHFYEFLDGAHAMDHHFSQTEFSKNLPVLLGLLGIWYINFFGCQQQAIIPYAHELRYFRNVIQQADMESNGKSVTRANQPVDYTTGPVILGQQGGDSQHSFFQHLHQAPHFTPVDFILIAKGTHFKALQPLLIASALSQAEALMKGRAEKNHQSIPGNRPSTVLFLEKITPHALGSLMALYEHKIFVQSVIWDINPFDQFGVELGKQLLPGILNDLKQSHKTHEQDASTTGLIQYYRSIV